MPMLTISGRARAVVVDPAAEIAVTDVDVLKQLHGLATREEICEQLAQEPPFSDLALTGGRLRFVLDSESRELRITTSYDVERELSPADLDRVVEATLSQWSDGLGSGLFINHLGEVLSTSMAQAIRNLHGSEVELGEYFVDAYPFLDERDVGLEWSDNQSTSDLRMQDLGWAADQGIASAQFLLGRHYHEGAGGLEQDLRRAFDLYQAAGEGGYTLALGMVGHFYETGSGVSQELTEAAKWYQRGTDAGDLVCQAQLAECYEMGKGLDKDLHLALRLYQDCYHQGFEAVEEALERVRSLL